MTVKCQWPVSNVDHPVIKGAEPTTGHPVDQPRDVAHHWSARCARSPLLDREFTTSSFVFHENTETALLRRDTKVSIAAPFLLPTTSLGACRTGAGPMTPGSSANIELATGLPPSPAEGADAGHRGRGESHLTGPAKENDCERQTVNSQVVQAENFT